MLHQHCPGLKKRSEQFQTHRVGVGQDMLTSGESDSPATLEIIAPVRPENLLQDSPLEISKSQARSATGCPPCDNSNPELATGFLPLEIIARVRPKSRMQGVTTIPPLFPPRTTSCEKVVYVTKFVCQFLPNMELECCFHGDGRKEVMEGGSSVTHDTLLVSCFMQ